jgi:inositol-phosphate phosphatase / L-galactose 1-phosphate phosphatase / histidinol-phosphatase
MRVPRCTQQVITLSFNLPGGHQGLLRHHLVGRDNGKRRMPNLSMTAIASFATSLIPVAHTEIRQGYHTLLRELRENRSLSDRIDREGLPAVLAGSDPAITALQKGNKEFVTAAERSAERLLRDQIGQRFPSHTLTGEELPAQTAEAQWIWSIDPVDGTSAMVRAAIAAAYGLTVPTPEPAFGISIGLLHDDAAAFGVIAELLPRDDTLSLGHVWAGGVDTPATCDGRPVSIATARSLRESVLACTVPEIMFSTADRWGSFQALADASACLVTDQNCIGYMGLLNGTVDIACERDLLLPDAAAIVPILQSAGIVVTDHEGQPVAFDATARDSEYLLMAAQGELHHQAIAVYRQGVPLGHNRFHEAGPAKLGYVRKVN